MVLSENVTTNENIIRFFYLSILGEYESLLIFNAISRRSDIREEHQHSNVS